MLFEYQPCSFQASFTTVCSDRDATQKYLTTRGFIARKAQLSKTSTRGLLLPAGGRAQMAGAYLLLRFVREALNSRMPAEVVYNGVRELDGSMEKLLLSLPFVTLIDGSKVSLPAHHGVSQQQALNHGWSFKVWALCYATSFREVLMVDADNTLLVPPEALFATQEWQQHGNLFWPDFMRGGEGYYWSVHRVLRACMAWVAWHVSCFHKIVCNTTCQHTSAQSKLYCDRMPTNGATHCTGKATTCRGIVF